MATPAPPSSASQPFCRASRPETGAARQLIFVKKKKEYNLLFIDSSEVYLARCTLAVYSIKAIDPTCESSIVHDSVPSLQSAKALHGAGWLVSEAPSAHPFCILSTPRLFSTSPIKNCRDYQIWLPSGSHTMYDVCQKANSARNTRLNLRTHSARFGVILMCKLLFFLTF